jgi:outer membrane protein insertion porin family
LGYDITPDLSVSTELRGEDVKMFNPRVRGVEDLERTLGSNDLYTARFRLAHNTRDSPFLPTEGHLLELIYDQVFGEFDFPRGQVNFSKYFLVRERADGSGRHTFTSAIRTGFAGADQPIFENFYAGGFSTLRGFQFRGAGPSESDVRVGGRFQFLGTFEYMFPITADDMLRMVAFVDYGTIERDININWKDFRVAPGLGFRIAVPALGPAPLAFDFAVPVAYADTDQRQVFQFSAGITR